MVTVAMSTTTNSSRVFIEVLRILSALALAIGLLYLLFKKTNLQHQRNVFITFVCFMLLGVGLQYIHQDRSDGLSNSFYNLVIIGIGALAFSCTSQGRLSEGAAKVLASYFFLIALLTLLVGGILFEFPPRFNLEYLSDGDQEEFYSLGVSQFFGMGSVLCAFLATKSESRLKVGTYIIGWLFYIVLCVLGGARGDSLLALFFSFFIIYRKFPLGIIWGSGLVIIAAWISNIGQDAVDQLVLYQRLVAGGGDLGDRDILILKSISLLEEQPGCLIIGCGFNYFQYFFRVDQGLYPHNFIMEMIITFGVPITILILGAAVIGIKKNLRAHGGLTYITILFFYCTAIGLKSQSLLTNWFMTAGLLYYASMALPYRKTSDCYDATPSITVIRSYPIK
jgi:hypothetical protein